MNVVVDPVWPWSRLWEVLLAVPPAVRGFALLAALAAGVLAALWLAGVSVRRRGFVVTSAIIAAALVLFARHAYSPAYADALSLRAPLPMLSALLLVAALVALLLALPVLAGLAAGSYLTANVSPRRRFVVLALRLLAFLLAFTALVRPALGWSERTEVRSTLLLALDGSKSMTSADEEGNVSRWAHLLAQLDAAKPALDRLRDAGTDVRLVRFADAVSDFDPRRPPDGPTTDVGAMLRDLFERRAPEALPRAVLVVSDGADHGQGALAEAARWRNAQCPVITFASGSPTTALKQNDVAVTSITTSPQPTVPMKGKLTVRLTADARGYENQLLKVRLLIEDKEKGGERELLARDVRPPLLTAGNELTLVADAPDQPGEYLLRAVVQTPEPDAAPANNAIETFVTVSKEGVSVLLVDRSRFEPVFIFDALNAARVRVTPVWMRGGAAGKDVLKLDDQPYDVIIMGDVSPNQLTALDPRALEKIEKQVGRGTGLLLMGGYNAFGPAWKGTPLEAALPIDLGEQKQDDNPTRMVPTDDGLRVARYLFRVDDGDEKAAWEKFQKLDGRSVIRLPEKPRGTETVLAKTANGEPLLIGGSYGSGKAVARVLAFGGDTTHRWVRDEESRRRFERFWRQAVLWLGHQEDTEGGVWVRPDAATRRLAAGGDLSFRVGLRGKGGVEALGGTFEADVTAPDGTKARVPLSKGASETRGVFAATKRPGVYRIDVKGSGKDESGTDISGSAAARVIVFDEDLEMTRVAADHEYLKKLAAAGGGESHRVEALKDVLQRLAAEPGATDVARRRHAPDWRTTSRSGFLAGFVLAFCAVACLEWGLRRLWGMV